MNILKFIFTVIFISSIFAGCSGDTSAITPLPGASLGGIEEEHIYLEEDDLEEYEGRIGMLTEDAELYGAYSIALADNDRKVLRTYEDGRYTLAKNDIVLVLYEKDGKCKIAAYGEPPPLMGCIDADVITYDTALIEKSSNLARADGATGYTDIDGADIGIMINGGRVEERRDGWARIHPYGGANEFWVKEEDLTYQFGTTVTDLKHTTDN